MHVTNSGTNARATRFVSAGCCLSTRPTIYCRARQTSIPCVCITTVRLERRGTLGILGSLQSSTRLTRVLGAVVVALIPCSAAAADVTTPPKEPLRTALAEVRPANVVTPRPPSTVARRSEQASTPAKQSPAFFKTPAGIAVLAVLGAGAGYAIYSAQHDRIHSPGKK